MTNAFGGTVLLVFMDVDRQHSHDPYVPHGIEKINYASTFAIGQSGRMVEWPTV